MKLSEIKGSISVKSETREQWSEIQKLLKNNGWRNHMDMNDTHGKYPITVIYSYHEFTNVKNRTHTFLAPEFIAANTSHDPH